jgi:hypothetical protein
MVIELEICILVAVVSIVIEAVKQFFKLETRFMPLLAVILGISVAYIQNLDILVGVLIGGSACGLYDIASKSVLGK